MSITRDVSNSEDILDSRDIIKRIEELEQARDDWQEDNELPDYIPGDSPQDLEKIKAAGWTDEQSDKWGEWDESEEGEELKALLDLQSQAEGYGDWSYGATLIRDSYFEDYARQFAEDIGAISGNESWPNNCIDWKQAADELQMDYASVEFDGVTYWIR